MCSTRIFFLIDDRHHVTSVFIWVNKLLEIPTRLFSTRVIFGLPFLVRHDFVAFHTFVNFLTNRLAFCVGSTVVGIALISSEYFVTCTALSPYCFLRDTHTTLCETTFAYIAAAMFRFRIVPFNARIPNTNSSFKES